MAYYKGLLNLMSGLVVSRFIWILSLPILSFLFVPETFADYSVVLSLVAVISQIILLRGSLIISAQVKDIDLHYSFVIANTTAFMLLIVFLTKIFGAGLELPTSLEIIIIAGYFTATLLIYQSLGIKRKKLIDVNVSRIITAVSFCGCAVGFYFAYGMEVIAMALAYLLSQLFGCLYLFYRLRPEFKRDVFISKTYVSIVRQCKKYFTLSYLENFLIMLGLQMSIFIIGMQGDARAGGFFLAVSITLFPASLIVGVASQYHLNYLSDIELKKTRSIRTLKNLLIFLGFGVVMYLPALFISDIFISHFLGQDWQLAKTYMPMLLGLAVLHIVFGSFSSSFYVEGVFIIGLVLHMIGAASRIGAVTVLPEYGFNDPAHNFIVASIVIYALGLFILLGFNMKNAFIVR